MFASAVTAYNRIFEGTVSFLSYICETSEELCLLIITVVKNADTIFLNINHFRMNLLPFALSAAKTLCAKCILLLQSILKAKAFTELISK